ncbi:MAG: hypothetical protein LC744_03215 [Chloroflexi bacterium]|nr:hypothetical protein [Chloroflexota bacterium]
MSATPTTTRRRDARRQPRRRGLDDTMAALAMGQVDELVIDETVAMDEELRAELVRQAAATDAAVTVVRDHAGLAPFEGVAGTLRFRI